MCSSPLSLFMSWYIVNTVQVPKGVGRIRLTYLTSKTMLHIITIYLNGELILNEGINTCGSPENIKSSSYNWARVSEPHTS